VGVGGVVGGRVVGGEVGGGEGCGVGWGDVRRGGGGGGGVGWGGGGAAGGGGWCGEVAGPRVRSPAQRPARRQICCWMVWRV